VRAILSGDAIVWHDAASASGINFKVVIWIVGDIEGHKKLRL
jgi:hypothetical protein